MGTIVERKRKDGTSGFTVQIVKKQNGKIVHREARTFDRKQAAKSWMARRETELSEPGALERAKVPSATLSAAIDRYIAESQKAIGRTKSQVLATIKKYDIADMECSAIRSAELVTFATELSADRKPQTVGNYVSHLAAVFAIAKPAWGYPLDQSEMKAAQTVLGRMGVTAKAPIRTRRPTLHELDLLMQHFTDRQIRSPKSAPMTRIIAFAIFSTRRQEEITRIKWSDLEPDQSRILVRDMKNPGQKIGNDIWCDLPPEALSIAQAMPRAAEQIFPYTTDAITASFTRACRFLGIDDLRFHDLRHEGVTRLFEMGRTIPLAASVSGHKSWSSLQRYTHIRKSGDKYDGWKWLQAVTTPMGRSI